jgi:hypothetical protein
MALFAGKGREMAKVDIKGAFIQTPMSGTPVYVRVSKNVSKYVVEMFPEWEKYLTKDGVLYTRMLKAMYGCVQASRLWFELLTGVLRDAGYVSAAMDECVMAKEGNVITIYVDDLLIFAEKREIEALRALLMDKFQWITMVVENSVSYLGMQIDRWDNQFEVGMDFFVQKLLAPYESLPVRGTPGTKATYQVDGSSARLVEAERKIFHTETAKLLFLAKRVRPDMLTVVSFLCTRVTCATVEDRKKLARLLGYLKGTATQRLVISPVNNLQLHAYIDASFALHDDSKSHSGVVIMWDKTVLYVASRKQKCVTKSPTEAELVALTDNLGIVMLFHEFVSFLVKDKVPLPLVHQDCTAVVTLVTQGGGVTRTKHLRVRMHLAKEQIEKKRLVVKYTKAKDMVADGASKPLEGEDFLTYRRAVQGTTG